MAERERETIAVPFGIDAVPDPVVSVRSGKLFARAEVPFPCLVIGSGPAEPLRLNNAPQDLFPQATNDEVTAPLEVIRLRMTPLCDPWNANAVAFLETYFRAVEAAVDSQAEAIAEQAVAFGSLFTARDWTFSAPCPLPRAHLPVGDGGERVAVDFAFWTGTGFVALDVAPPALLPKAARARRERLAAAGIRRRDGIPADWKTFFAELMPEPRTTFWQGETLPVGPLPGAALDAIDAMAPHP